MTSSRSMAELFRATNDISHEMLGKEATSTEIDAALHVTCPRWSETDTESVLVLAALLAGRLSHEFYYSDYEWRAQVAQGVHYGFLAHRLNLYLGLADELSAGERDRMKFDRECEYPLIIRSKVKH